MEPTRHHRRPLHPPNDKGEMRTERTKPLRYYKGQTISSANKEVELEVEPSTCSVQEFINNCRTDESNDDIKSVRQLRVTELREATGTCALSTSKEKRQGDL
jgi:hypothetical protein